VTSREGEFPAAMGRTTWAASDLKSPEHHADATKACCGSALSIMIQGCPGYYISTSIVENWN
jgi:hypothetical protein